jgi:hypothetical protein
VSGHYYPIAAGRPPVIRSLAFGTNQSDVRARSASLKARAVHAPRGRKRHRRVLGEERLAARCRRPLRRSFTTRDQVPQGAQGRAHGVPGSHALGSYIV